VYQQKRLFLAEPAVQATTSADKVAVHVPAPMVSTNGLQNADTAACALQMVAQQIVANNRCSFTSVLLQQPVSTPHPPGIVMLTVDHAAQIAAWLPCSAVMCRLWKHFATLGPHVRNHTGKLCQRLRLRRLSIAIGYSSCKIGG
jgi:hypothetical protein